MIGSVGVGRFLLKVFQNLLNYPGIFNTGYDFDLTAAVLTDLNIDAENSFKSLHPGHGTMPVCWALVVPVGIGRFWIGLLAAFGRCDLNAVFTIGGPRLFGLMAFVAW